jgi:hypothetical protein
MIKKKTTLDQLHLFFAVLISFQLAVTLKPSREPSILGPLSFFHGPPLLSPLSYLLVSLIDISRWGAGRREVLRCLSFRPRNSISSYPPPPPGSKISSASGNARHLPTHVGSGEIEAGGISNFEADLSAPASWCFFFNLSPSSPHGVNFFLIKSEAAC